MNKEYGALVYSLINNLIVSIIKMTGGVICLSNSLLADGFHTFSDFVTDIFALFGAKMSKKRANKKHPLGYGKVEYIISLFIALFIFVIGVFIIISAFTNESYSPSLKVLYFVIISIILKFISSTILLKTGHKINSKILLTSSKESFTDVYSSMGVVIIVILSQFSNYISILKYSDLIGAIFIALLIFKTAYTLMKDNILALIGETFEDEKIMSDIEKIIEKYKKIKIDNIKLIMNGNYYEAMLRLQVDKSMSVVNLMKKESNIRREIKKSPNKIKFVSIEIVPMKRGN